MTSRSIRRASVALCAAAATSFSLLAVTPAQAIVVDDPITDFANAENFTINPIGSYDTGQFDESAAEIVTYHPGTEQLLVVNALSGNIDLLDISDPANPTKAGEVEAGEDNGINSVAVRADGLAVANVEPADKTDEGSMLFFNANTGEELGRVLLGGSLPDMVGISADGKYAFSANEGEPAEDYSVDPEGSVSVVTLPDTVAAPTQDDVRVAGFRAWNEDGPETLHEDIRIFGPSHIDGTVAQNLEPEYITEIDGKLYTTLQENNAVAVIDIETATVEEIFPLGFQDHSEIPLDASDRDGGEDADGNDTGAIEIKNWPVMGIHQPDAIEAYTAADGNGYLVMANEGDARDWDAYSEEVRIKHLGDEDEEDYAGNPLPPLCEGYQGLSAGEIDELQDDLGAGRLRITIADGLNEDGTCYEQLYSYGSRSFSIFDVEGNEVFNSGAFFEQHLAELHEKTDLIFNAGHDEGWFDSRSDNKGPEPEGVALGEINDRTYAFIGLERVGGVFVYDVTDPANSEYVAYVNNRDFSVSALDEDTEELVDNWAEGGDLGAEGLVFISAEDSPNGKNLLAVGNEVSGTTTIFEIGGAATGDEPGDTDPGDEGSSSDLSSGSSFDGPAGTLAVLAGVLGAIGIGAAMINTLFPHLPANLAAQVSDLLK